MRGLRVALPHYKKTTFFGFLRKEYPCTIEKFAFLTVFRCNNHKYPSTLAPRMNTTLPLPRCPIRTAVLFAAILSANAHAQSIEDLAEMSIDDLASVQITSVSKKAQSLGDAAAAVFVITREDIRRSGGRSLPEILRLAPNLQVARVNASEYAISARGFNSTTANKLLVLINGRSVYTPLYSGVFWDTPDQLPENIEQIEVISGPGGTLWGANAVNGVINIITRKAKDTEGSLVSAIAGKDERSVSLRHGAALGEHASFRMTARGFARDASYTVRGARSQDEWEKNNLEFYLDWKKGRDALTLDLNAYKGTIDQVPPRDKTISGSHVLARWSRDLADAGTFQLQAYVDHGHRQYPGTFGEKRDTYDIEMQHHFVSRGMHDVVWGAGYRHSRDRIENSALLAFLPADSSLTSANLFVQDTMRLGERLSLVLGIKAEHSSISGYEWLPNARLLWKTASQDLLWTAVSRAVRTPSRIDTDLYSPGNPPHTAFAGGPGFTSEKLTAIEAGYRMRPHAAATLSVSVFYHHYDELRSVETGPPTTLANKLGGDGYGIEVWGGYRFSDSWRLDAGYNYLKKDLKLDAGSRDITSLRSDTDPRYQFLLRSSMRPKADLEFDATLRSVGALASPQVPSYVALDARLAWTANKKLTLAVWGSNLFDERHPEFGNPATRSEIGRTISVSALWKF